MITKRIKNIVPIRYLLLFFLCTFLWGNRLYGQYYPVHATVQLPSPQSPYLSDYYSGSRDRLIVTLFNRDLQQPLLHVRLRVRIKSTGFLASSREDVSYPIIDLSANVPRRLTTIDLSSYLVPDHLNTSGSIRDGRLPTGYTEFSVQVVDYYTGRILSDWHTGRSYLDLKKPPFLNYPEKGSQIGITDPLYIRFQWMPRHQGLSGTEYEFVLKELPDNGAAPQSAFAYGNEIFRVRTRNTTLNYTHLDPILLPNRCYAWQVQAIARDGVDEIGMFDNGGFSEINWFYLNDNCDAPKGLKSKPRFAKVDLSWNKVIGTTGYVLECRPKTRFNVYEWSSTRVAGESLTLAQLKPGWTYEWRVGTLCTDDHPVFSDIHEFTLSKYNEELISDCGKEPVRKDLSQDPNLNIKAGDIVTIGGDYPMTITESIPLGDGWYSGRGKTRLKTIIDAPIYLRFDRLRINVDNFQIDGTVEAFYNEEKSKIANLDYVDDGGNDIKPATIRIREHKIDFTLPDIPQFTYNPNSGELETTDTDGNPQTIKIDAPENTGYKSIFPMVVTDNKGNSYQIDLSEGNSESAASNNTGIEGKENHVGLSCKRVERIGDFNTASLSSEYGYVLFELGDGKYAFDAGNEKWYKNSVKVDRFYKPFAKGYISPWKLIPSGENDIVTARYDGVKDIDLKKVRFVSEPNSVALPARLNETDMTWTISLRSVSPGTSYDVYALYEGEVIGKLRVVSYAQQKHKVTIVPINDVQLDKSVIERELNAIYNPVGIQFTVEVDESMRGNYDWEVASEKDSLLSTVGKSFWGYDKELKESTEMLNLKKHYKDNVKTLDGVYLFILNGAKGLEGQKDGLLGEMPRKSRFGYIFSGNSPNTDGLSHTIAHELGHGLFTLQHTFDYEYAGEKSKGTTLNLMDYNPNGKELAAFQWNIMANPALLTAMDNVENNKIRQYKSRIVCIPKKVSDAIMSSEKAVLSAGGKKIELPKGTIIKSLFFDDMSQNPAPNGSIAEFDVDRNSYKTWYEIQTGRFIDYGYTLGKDTVYLNKAPSIKESINIIIDPNKYTITVEGKVFLLDSIMFTCGDQKISTTDLKNFYIDTVNKRILRDIPHNNIESKIYEDQEIIEDLMAKFRTIESHGVITIPEFKKHIEKEFNYKGKGLADNRRFIVISTSVQYGTTSEDDWNELARVLFKKLELSDNDVLVTIPYVVYNAYNIKHIPLYMPGIAFGKDTKLNKQYFKNQYNCTDRTVGQSGHGIGDFILYLFETCEIPPIRPRVLIQTLTKPGFGVKEDRNKYEFEDAQGNGLTPASNIIAEDMKYGTSFDLSTIKDDKVRENLERLSKKTDDELFKNLINLAEWVSRGDLEDNNKRMISEWRKKTYQISDKYYTDPRLTDAVFKATKTITFIDFITKYFFENLKNSNWALKYLKFNLKETKLSRPSFSFKSDLGSGLTFALNDTWGFKVTLLNYRYDAASKKYWAKLRFDIFDHFGLDVDDVEKFGSMEKVRDKIKVIGKAISLIDDTIFEQAANGFCSWFILQYMRGYKPFVTMMSKEIEIEKTLEE